MKGNDLKREDKVMKEPSRDGTISSRNHNHNFSSLTQRYMHGEFGFLGGMR